MSKPSERKEVLLNNLKNVVIFLGILFLIAHFSVQYSLLINRFLEGNFNLMTTVDLFYTINIVVLSIIIFVLIIFFLDDKNFRIKHFKVIDIATERDITDHIELQIHSENKKLDV